VAQMPPHLEQSISVRSRSSERSERSTIVPGSHASKLGHPQPESNF